MTMKLNLFFIAMTLLTVFAYPFVFVYGKLGQFSKSTKGIHLANLLVAVPITPGR
jgi:hypothetical protein